MKKTCKSSSPVIRAAGLPDSPGIFSLIKSYPEELVPRSMNDIIQNIDRFMVCADGADIVGTAAWSILPEIGDPARTCIEIKSVAVARALQRTRIGTELVMAVLERVSPLKPAQVIALTFAPDFFARLGFVEIPKDRLMHKLYMGCINCAKYDNPFTCPEIAMSLDPRRLSPPYGSSSGSVNTR